MSYNLHCYNLHEKIIDLTVKSVKIEKEKNRSEKHARAANYPGFS